MRARSIMDGSWTAAGGPACCVARPDCVAGPWGAGGAGRDGGGQRVIVRPSVADTLAASRTRSAAAASAAVTGGRPPVRRASTIAA